MNCDENRHLFVIETRTFMKTKDMEIIACCTSKS